MTSAQIKSKQRVAERGEVLTGEREVNAMLDLVKQETERIESRFLEPACGTGNFLVEILRRKLGVVDRRYKRSRHEWERNAVVAVSSIYGIDILEDNVQDCRDRLFVLFSEFYERRFRRRVQHECRETVRYLLGRDIIWGDALDMKTVGPNPGPIIFSEWSPVHDILIMRRDFIFEYLTRCGDDDMELVGEEASLFGDDQESLFTKRFYRDVADTGESSLTAKAIPPEYRLVHFLEIAHAYD